MTVSNLARYQPYSEYKPSGLEWLGDIPKGWKASKIKFAATFQVGWTPPTNIPANFIGENKWANISDLGSKYLSDTAKTISDTAALKASMAISPAGSLLYSFKLSVGAVSFAAEDMYTNEAIATFLQNEELPLSYLYYLTPIFIIQNASTNIYGARILNQELIRNADILLPSFGEALKIAAFLDHETVKIDELITNQQRLIDLLEEKRQAVISHAVTNGLNPNAPLRPSGIDWLGDVPSHWDTRKLNLLVSTRKGVAFKADDFKDAGVRVAKVSDIKKLTFQLSDVFLPPRFIEAYPKAILKEGNIVLSTVGSNPSVKNSAVGQVGRVPESHNGSILNQNTVVFDVDEVLTNEDYVFTILLTRGYRDHLDLHAHGTANQSSLNLSDMLNFVIPLPDKVEQAQIVAHLRKDKEVFDGLVASSYLAINLLKERRTALISAAVTGKIDVRDWQRSSEISIEDIKQDAAA